jgi:glc operon protein GlcG
VNFRRPTKALEDAVAGGARLRLLAVQGITPLEVGVPILVSGVTSAQDAQIARAGIDALK